MFPYKGKQVWVTSNARPGFYFVVCGVVPFSPLCNREKEIDAFRSSNGSGGNIVIKIPNPIDKHVGGRVRMRRMLLSMSQEKLGDALGLTFQQVQKYEKGTNRIGASRLQQISKALNVTAAYFFEGVPLGEGNAVPGFGEGPSPTFIVDFLSTSEGLNLNKAFARIKDPKVRKRIIDLVTVLGEDEAGAPVTNSISENL